MNGANSFQSFLANLATPLQSTGSNAAWNFELADWNSDGRPDIFVILKTGASGKTEVHILNGANSYQTFSFNGATILSSTGSDEKWNFKVGDYNGDGTPDIYAINRQGASGRTEISVMDGRLSFSAFLTQQVASILSAVPVDNSCEFELN
jgi:hypothetical protein